MFATVWARFCEAVSLDQSSHFKEKDDLMTFQNFLQNMQRDVQYSARNFAKSPFMV